jgi:hypothetical protein
MVPLGRDASILAVYGALALRAAICVFDGCPAPMAAIPIVLLKVQHGGFSDS